MATKEDVRKVQEAIRAGDIETVKEMISSGTVDVNEIIFGKTFLHTASICNQLEIAKFLIESGIELNRLDRAKSSALINAVIKGNLEMVKLLCESGAELDTSNPDNNPLFRAGPRHQEEIAQYLVDQGIDIYKTYHIGDMENCDAYKWARSWGDLSVPVIVASKEREEKKLFEMTLKDDGKEIFDFLSSKHGYLVNYNSFDEIPEDNIAVLCKIDGKLYCGSFIRRLLINNNLKGVSFSVVQ